MAEVESGGGVAVEAEGVIEVGGDDDLSHWFALCVKLGEGKKGRKKDK